MSTISKLRVSANRNSANVAGSPKLTLAIATSGVSGLTGKSIPKGAILMDVVSNEASLSVDVGATTLAANLTPGVVTGISPVLLTADGAIDVTAAGTAAAVIYVGYVLEDAREGANG